MWLPVYVLFIIDLPHSSSYELPPTKRIKLEDSDGMYLCVELGDVKKMSRYTIDFKYHDITIYHKHSNHQFSIH